MTKITTDIERLREVALDQYGYVTTAQALDEGVSKPALAMMAKRQRLERMAHGVYRVPQMPVTRYDQLMLAVLWAGAPEAVLSHDTALDAYEVSDINPTSIHITVAKKRRIARQGGEGYTLHHQDLVDNQKTWWEGIPIVTLYTAIEQGITSRVPTYLLRQAIERGRQLGLLLDCEQAGLMKLLERRYAR